MFVIKRPINGISINGDEYLLDEEGNVKEFNSKREAIEFLAANGMTRDCASLLVHEEQD